MRGVRGLRRRMRGNARTKANRDEGEDDEVWSHMVAITGGYPPKSSFRFLHTSARTRSSLVKKGFTGGYPPRSSLR